MVTRQDRDATTAVFNVVIHKEELKQSIDSELKMIRQKAPIDGFRKGHVPATLVKKRYGKSIFADKFGALLSKKLEDYLKESPVDMIGYPVPAEGQEWPDFDVDNIFDSFTFRYEALIPPADFVVQGLDGVDTYDKYAATDLHAVAEEEVDKVVKNAKGQVSVDDSIEMKDMVLLDSKELSGEGGEVLEGGHQIEIKVMPESIHDEDVREALLGKQKGDIIRFNARTLENLNDAQYRKYILQLAADQEKVVGDFFEGTITDVFRLKEGVANEDFYKKSFGPSVTNREEAVAYFEKELTELYNMYANQLVYEEVREALIAQNPVTVSEYLLNKMISIGSKGEKSSAETEKERTSFYRMIQWEFIERSISDRFNLSVSPSEVRKRMIYLTEKNLGISLGDDFWEKMTDRLMQDQEKVQQVHRQLVFEKVMFQGVLANVQTREIPVPAKVLEAKYNSSMGVKSAETASDPDSEAIVTE